MSTTHAQTREHTCTRATASHAAEVENLAHSDSSQCPPGLAYAPPIGRSEENEREEMREIPLGRWLPACSLVLPTTCLTNSSVDRVVINRGTTAKDKALISETKGSRLLQAYMKYRDANGVTKVGRVKLDTQSNGCYSLPGVSLPRAWRPWEPRSVRGIGGTFPLGEPQYFTVLKDGEPIKVDTHVPTRGRSKTDALPCWGWMSYTIWA